MALTKNRPYSKDTQSGGGGARSAHGYDMFETASALQKAIRRGREEEAMYWALEFLPKYDGWLWRRLLVIVNEDIGIASLQVVQFVTNQLSAWYTMLKLNGKDELKLILANTILAMCRSPKSRISDQFQCVVDHQNSTQRLDIPDHALDKHTRRGKAMGRGMEHFFSQGALLSPESDIENPYQERARAIWNSDFQFPSRTWTKPSSSTEKRMAQLTLI